MTCASGSVLSHAKLYSSNPNLKYDFKCQQVYIPSGAVPTVNITASTILAGSNSLDLASHQVACPAGAALRQFQLRWSWATRAIWYQFECLQVKNLPVGGACTPLTTTYAVSGGNLELYRHALDCAPSGKLLTDFVLEKEAASTKVRYSYTCC